MAKIVLISLLALIIANEEKAFVGSLNCLVCRSNETGSACALGDLAYSRKCEPRTRRRGNCGHKFEYLKTGNVLVERFCISWGENPCTPLPHRENRRDYLNGKVCICGTNDNCNSEPAPASLDLLLIDLDRLHEDKCKSLGCKCRHEGNKSAPPHRQSCFGFIAIIIFICVSYIREVLF